MNTKLLTHFIRTGIMTGAAVFSISAAPSFDKAFNTDLSVAGAQILKGAQSKHIGVDSSMYVKAHNMVANGDGEGGRALVDSLFALAREGTAEYAEGLYWRARVAQSAESAQRDYVRIIVDYSLSPRVPNALLNVGQIELVRGEREKALRYFERLRRDYPGHPLQALAGYWAARTLFEVNDLQRACATNAEALALVKSGNVELKNRIEFQNQRCRGVVLATQDSGSGRSGTVGTAVPVIAEAQPPKADEEDEEEVTAPAAAEAGETFSVQVGALGTRAKANELVAALKKQGYTARIIGDQPLFRVRVGSFRDRDGAASLLAELKAKKFDGFITKE